MATLWKVTMVNESPDPAQAADRDIDPMQFVPDGYIIKTDDGSTYDMATFKTMVEAREVEIVSDPSILRYRTTIVPLLGNLSVRAVEQVEV